MRLSYLFNSYSFSHLSHTFDLLPWKSVCDWPDGLDFRHNCVLMSLWNLTAEEERDPSLCLSWEQCRHTQPLYVLFDMCCLFKQCINDSEFATVPAYLVHPVGEKEVRQWIFGKSASVTSASGATHSPGSGRWCWKQHPLLWGLVHLAYHSLLDPKGICRKVFILEKRLAGKITYYIDLIYN